MMYLCYTDGGCRVSERSPGGWGVYVRPPKGEPIEKYGGELDTFSTVMELRAVKEALLVLPSNVEATLFSDSQEVISYCDKGLAIWRANGWKNVPALILPTMKEISGLLEEKNLKVIWTWIRGHNGNKGNERADQLADQGAREAKQKLKEELKKKSVY